MVFTPSAYAKSLAVKGVFHCLPVPNLLVDAGCGNGLYLSQVEASQKIGMDLNMASFTLSTDRNIEGVRGDIRFMPFREETIDCLMALDCIEHVEEDGSAIAEFYRILKDGGFLVLTTPTKNEFLPALIRKLFKLDTAKFHRKWEHLHPGYDNKEILNLLKRGHFHLMSHQNFEAPLTRTLGTLIWTPLLDIYNRGKSGMGRYHPKKKGRIVTVLEKAHGFVFQYTFLYLIKWAEKRNRGEGFTHLVVARKAKGRGSRGCSHYRKGRQSC